MEQPLSNRGSSGSEWDSQWDSLIRKNLPVQQCWAKSLLNERPCHTLAENELKKFKSPNNIKSLEVFKIAINNKNPDPDLAIDQASIILALLLKNQSNLVKTFIDKDLMKSKKFTVYMISSTYFSQ